VVFELSVFNRLGRALRIIREATGFIVPIHRITGEAAPLSLTVYRDAYLKDPSISAAVDYLAEQAVGVGFFNSSQNPDAKALVEKFTVQTGMDQLLMQNAKECVYGGNSFLEKVRDDNNKLVNLKLLPLTSIRRIRREPISGKVLWYDQRVGGAQATLGPDQIVHFKYNPQDGEAFGSPVIRSLLETYPVDDRYTRESFLKIKARMEAIMPKIFMRYASPKRVWVFPGVTDAKRDEYKQAIEQSPEDEDLAFNPPDKDSFDIKNLEIDPRARFEGFINYIESQYIAGMQTPVVKLYTAPGFTEASATGAKEISERKIDFLRRFLKRIVEREIYADLLKSNGYEKPEDQVTFNWGLEKPEVTLADVITLAQVSAETGVAYMTKEETRGMLRKFGFEISEEKPAEPTETPASPEAS
jgi:hypothetical protein